MKKSYLLLSALFCVAYVTSAQTQTAKTPPPVVHPQPGTSASTADGRLTLKLHTKLQNYDWADNGPTRDTDIHSPKSVNIHPDGTKLYINSLEGASTVVYDAATLKKLKTISHRFNASHSPLWTTPDYYKFNHTYTNPRHFTGKPVESTFSHGGRYLWIPYYRRSFDINAQDPSAIAVIDTRTDSIVRLMDAGVLPKMIATSPDGRLVAVAHWGDNTVGIIDISADNPRLWHHKAMIPIGKQLKWDLSLTEPVDRDNNSGLALRGTVFTDDSRYLLVGAMGGGGGIAVIDTATLRHIGTIYGMRPNMRHLIFSGGDLYLSINRDGIVQRITREQLNKAIATLAGGKRTVTVPIDAEARVSPGARTIAASPDGRYIYAACNTASRLHAIDTSTMKSVLSIEADSYPVGLDVSADGRWIFTTSQGRSRQGGNAVDIYQATLKH
ncbi:MAG: hypothetical protein K2M98_00930 [Muribaculum sp.]|nr:hypothetical protein [Muribaculum sp.]